MPILSGDIKLLASQIMDDVPEGGGAPTANIIQDGVSNAIFPDVSEVARAGGQVSLAKVFVSVDTPDTDTYMGSNFIVAEPPADPNISITVFAGDVFGRRTAAASRVESYLTSGPSWGGYLFEHHIAGQRVLQILQRPDTTLPNVGQTLVLSMYEGLPQAYSQYVRATAVSAVSRLFYDEYSHSDFAAQMVSVSISDALRYDFTGSPASRTFTRATGSTIVRDTVVADAGTYAGITPLAQAASLGAFTVATESIYTQLVPSAQTETPITDVRSNGLSTALVATGGPVSQSQAVVLSTTQSLHVGGPILPGSFATTSTGITAIDAGGLLTVAGVEVGQVDYDNGIVSLSSNVWGTQATSHTYTFTPAAVPELISDQRAIPVTPESRALNYVLTLGNVPAPRSLSVSYLAQGRWYVLRDNGAGQLKGVSTAFGVGTVSYSTGTVSITLGALPDVGSSVILQSYSAATATAPSNTELANSGRLFVPINSSGAISTTPGAKALVPGAVSITWPGGNTVTDDGAGALTGAATGTVSYATGVIQLSPNTLPAPGTVLTVTTDDRTQGVATGVVLAGGNLGATNITPQSVSFPLFVTITYTPPAGIYRLGFTVRQVVVQVKDQSGNLYFSEGGIVYPCGTINYATGAINFVAPGALAAQDASGPVMQELIYAAYGYHSVAFPWGGFTAQGSRSASYALASDVTYSNTASANNSFNVTLDALYLQAPTVPNYVLKGVSFCVATTRYQQLTDGTLVKDVAPTTGGGTPAGTVSGALGRVTVTAWPAGQSSAVTHWRGLMAPPSAGVAAPFSGFTSVFRTAASPLRPGSLSVLGTMQDGTPFNVTAGTDGIINGARVKGRVDYQYGLVELHFVNAAGDVALNVDLSHLGIAGLSTIPADLAMLGSIRYNAVSFSYLPLDASLLGIDPVRLPSDGRVPIFRPGGFVVVGHTASVTATVSNAQTVNCARVRLSRVRVLGFDKSVINTGYTADLEAGTVTFSNVSGYSQPVTIEHRIEDMAVVQEMQISGELTFTRPLSHAYPLGSYVSSALMLGNLKARVSALYDQETWTSTWSDAQIGNAASATYNDVAYPLVVTNAGTITERWYLQFVSSTQFKVVGEHVGVLGTWTINDPGCAPINPAQGVPYFAINPLGWGTGWSVGNVVRINTIGPKAPVWVVRTVQQGPNTGVDHTFTLLSRGDVDAP